MDKRTIPGKYVPTNVMRNIGQCETCNTQSSVGSWKAHDGTEGVWCIKCKEKGVKARLVDVKVPVERWERGYTEVLCCGSWFRCDGFTNTCDCCGRDYNGSGQLLAPREQWGEETGETASDILGVNLTSDLG